MHILLAVVALWGSLEPGSNGVGFRTMPVVDRARPSFSAPVQGRELRLDVWYPATKGGRAILYGDYIDLLEKPEHFLERTQGSGGDLEALERAIPELRKLRTAAFENAPPVAGRHPLVVFPEGRSPATNNILSEYLASHGFVVASVPLHGALETEYQAGALGIETTARDIEFAIAELSALPFVDAKRIALMGVGIAASSCLTVAMRNPNIDGVISLEGGIPTAYEDGLLKQGVNYSLAAVRAPILGIHAPHPSVDPKLFDQYRYARRELVHFPKMTEFHFLNYGMLERWVPRVIGDAPGDTKLGFEWASRYVLAFVRETLEGEKSELNPPDGLLTTEVKSAMPPPPSLSELKAAYRGSTLPQLLARIRELRKTDPEPVPTPVFVDFHSWLSWNGDDDWNGRREMASLRVELFPSSSRAHFTLANVATQQKNAELARKHYQEALRLVDTDADPQLTASMRATIRERSQQALAN